MRDSQSLNQFLQVIDCFLQFFHPFVTKIHLLGIGSSQLGQGIHLPTHLSKILLDFEETISYGHNVVHLEAPIAVSDCFGD